MTSLKKYLSVFKRKSDRSEFLAWKGLSKFGFYLHLIFFSNLSRLYWRPLWFILYCQYGKFGTIKRLIMDEVENDSSSVFLAASPDLFFWDHLKDNEIFINFFRQLVQLICGYVEKVLAGENINAPMWNRETCFWDYRSSFQKRMLSSYQHSWHRG